MTHKWEPVEETSFEDITFRNKFAKKYCNNYCPYRHNENKRKMEPCINCPLVTWLDMVEVQGE